MACPRPGEECLEFMCGSSVDGICKEGVIEEPESDKWYKQAIADLIYCDMVPCSHCKFDKECKKDKTYAYCQDFLAVKLREDKK